MGELNKILCRRCFAEWVLGGGKDGKFETLTGEQLLQQNYAFDTQKEFIAHLKEKHNIKVVGVPDDVV